MDIHEYITVADREISIKGGGGGQKGVPIPEIAKRKFNILGLRS
jgi:hypothetical protein